MRYLKIGVVFFSLYLCIAGPAARSEEAKQLSALDAMEEATRNNKYLFVLCTNEKDSPESAGITRVFNQAAKTMDTKAAFIRITMTDPNEAEFIKRFGLEKKTKPIILALAPGGIVTKEFNDPVTLEGLTEALVTPTTLELLKAEQDNKYLFVLFFQDKSDANTRAMLEVFNQARSILADKAVFSELDVTDKTEAPFVKRFEVTRVAKPLILALAPGGIVTKGFIRKVTLEELEDAFVTPKTLEVLKANQAKKLIVLFFNNDKLEDFQKAQTIVNNVVEELSKLLSIQLITVDPTDKIEKALLKKAKVSAEITQAMVVVMQSGALKGTIKPGQLTAKALKDLINKSCGTDCGPGG